MGQPFNVQPNPGATDPGVASFDSAGNLVLSGDVIVGRSVRLGMTAAPPYDPAALRFYSTDGKTLSMVGRDGNPGSLGASNGSTAWYNVKAYKAVGDGVHDDAPAINAAIAAAAAAGGGVVYLPAGTYSTGAGLVITADGVSIRGDGRGATIIKPVTGATFDAISTPIPAMAGTAGFIRNFVGVERLTLDCSAMASTVAGAGNGIHFYGVRYSFIRELNITGCLNFGILLDGDATNFSYSIQVEGNRIVNGGGCFMATFSEEAFVRCNDFLQANATLAATQPAFAPQSNVGYIVRLVSGYTALIMNVIGSSGTYTSAAVQVENGGPTRIEGNRFDQCRFQAIRVTAPNTLIIGNQIGNPSSVGTVEGIRLGAANTTVIGNIFDTTNGAAHFTYCVAEAGGPYTGNVIAGNNLATGTSGTVSLNAASTARVFGNPGYNPVGPLTGGSAPTVPLTTVPFTNNFGVDATVTITGGAVTVIAIGGTATGLTSGTVRVPSGQTIAITYTMVPSWVWFLD